MPQRAQQLEHRLLEKRGLTVENALEQLRGDVLLVLPYGGFDRLDRRRSRGGVFRGTVFVRFPNSPAAVAELAELGELLEELDVYSVRIGGKHLPTSTGDLDEPTPRSAQESGLREVGLGPVGPTVKPEFAARKRLGDFIIGERELLGTVAPDVGGGMCLAIGEQPKDRQHQ